MKLVEEYKEKMNEMLFMEQLNSKLLENEKIFKFRQANLSNERYLTIEFLVNSYMYDQLFDKDLKLKIERIAKELLPKSIFVKLLYTKTITTTDLVKKTFFEFVNKEMPTFYENFLSSEINVDITATIVYINIELEKFLCDYAKNSDLAQEISNALRKEFMEEFEIAFLEIPNRNEVIDEIIIEKNAYSVRFVDVTVNSLLWGNIASNPRYIVDVKDRASSDICICGVISDITEKYIEKIGKNLFTFQLYDTTAYIRCKAFLNVARKEQDKVAKSMLSGNTFIMQGQIKYDTYDNALIFIPNKVAFCTINYNSIDNTPKYNTEREQYLYVHPVKYQELIQTDMLSTGIPKELFNKTFVVFDLETTGLEATKDGITEIAAVKIVNGRITETFTSLVNPEKDVPPEVIQLSGITNEMVKNERTFPEIIGDFYKFTRGEDVILVAHNSGFDMGFINKYASENNYLFDNAVIDTVTLARQKTKYNKFKLSYLCEKMQIPLVGAHRALNDAVATAKLFMKLFCL